MTEKRITICIWLALYKTLTGATLSIMLLLLPILHFLRPKLAKWFRMRFWPESIHFQPNLWIHAVSMGEIKIALALLEHCSHEFKENALLTTSTQSGYRLLTERFGKNRVRYLPWDLGICYRQLFHSYGPPNLIIVETEIWPCLFRFVTSSGSKLILVNGRLSAKTLRLKNNPLFQDALSQVHKVAARSALDFERFKTFGVTNPQLAITGNIKFDFKPKSLNAPKLVAWLTQNSNPLIIFASISTDEVPLLIPEVQKLFESIEGLCILWAPRHLNDLEVHLQSLQPFKPKLRSKLSPHSRCKMLILDTFGELSGCYAYAQISLIGGSFNQRGGQNFLESLQAGTPAMLGPHTENFKKEVEEALEEQAVLCLPKAENIATKVLELLNNPALLRGYSTRAKRFLEKHTGAIQRTLAVLIQSNFIIAEESEES